MEADVKVTMPASPEYVHILRFVLAGVLATLDCTIDQIEDLKLALSEAAAQLLAIEGSQTLTLTIREMGDVGNGEIRLVLSTDVSGEVWPPAEVERTFAWQVLSALADEVRFDRVDGRAALALTQHLNHREG